MSNRSKRNKSYNKIYYNGVVNEDLPDNFDLDPNKLERGFNLIYTGSKWVGGTIPNFSSSDITPPEPDGIYIDYNAPTFKLIRFGDTFPRGTPVVYTFFGLSSGNDIYSLRVAQFFLYFNPNVLEYVSYSIKATEYHFNILEPVDGTSYEDSFSFIFFSAPEDPYLPKFTDKAIIAITFNIKADAPLGTQIDFYKGIPKGLINQGTFDYVGDVQQEVNGEKRVILKNTLSDLTINITP